MPIVNNSEFVKDRFDEVFRIDHGRNESLKHRYDSHFHLHGVQPEHWQEHGPISTASLPQNSRLVKVVFNMTLAAGEGEHERLIEQQLTSLREMLESMVHEGEECHLFVEERPEVHDDGTAARVVYHAKGIIAPKDLMPAG